MGSGFDQIKRFWRGLSTSRKIIVAGSVLSVIAGFILIFSWVSEPEYAVLFSGLESQDASKIIERLKERDIDYKLIDGGRTILVPKGNVYELRLSLISEGLPGSSVVGYELFDRSNFGVSDFVQKINYKRALEGELARTILQIEGVEAARVHIVIPEKALFKEDQKEPTASVVLKLKSGARLTRENVKSISYLVASSVEGLEPRNVTIMDSRGNLLSEDMGEDPLAKISSKQYELKRSVEQYLTNKVQTLLDGVLGPGNSIVRVNVDLDFTQIEKTIEEFDPDRTAIRSEQITQEKTSSIDTSFATTSSQRSNTITNYEVNRTIQRIVGEVGNIKRLSVAVLINGTYEVTEVDGVKKVNYIPRDEEQMRKLTEIVKNAVGFDPSRNDQISVVNIPFDVDVERDFIYREPSGEGWMDIVERVLIVVAILASVLIIFSLLGRLKPRREIPTVEVGEMPSVPGYQETPQIPSEMGEGISPEEMELVEEIEGKREEIEVMQAKRAQIMEKVTQFIRADPERATKLIKIWLVEEEEGARWRRR
jgi:flagellar M-ring protein FliF